MTRDSTITAGEYGGKEPAFTAQSQMADGIHAPVDPVKAADDQPMLDRTSSEPKALKPSSRDDTELPSRNFRQCEVS